MQRKNGEDEAMMAQNEHHEVNNYPAVPVLLDSEKSKIWEPESLVFDKEFCKGLVLSLPAICQEKRSL